MDTIMSIVNQITVTVPDVNMIIGVAVVVIFGWCAKNVWDTISGK